MASSKGSGLQTWRRWSAGQDSVVLSLGYLAQAFAIQGDMMVLADQKVDSVQLVDIYRDTEELSGGDMVKTKEQSAFVRFVDWNNMICHIG